MSRGGGFLCAIGSGEINVRQLVTSDLFLGGDLSGHPGGVAEEIELVMLGSELPQPGIVAHPVADQVGKPHFSLCAVVVGRGKAEPVWVTIIFFFLITLFLVVNVLSLVFNC